MEYIVDIPNPDIQNFYLLFWTPDGLGTKRVLDLTPYIEPDTESIRKEAYDKGYTDAAYNCHERCAFIDEAKKEAYQRGYETAKHECEDCNANAVKIADDKAHESYQKGLSDAWEAARTLWNTPNRKEIFGHTTFNTVLTTLTAQETIEKIRQYEQEKEIDGLRQNIQTIVDQCGYTLDEIAEVLQKMKKS